DGKGDTPPTHPKYNNPEVVGLTSRASPSRRTPGRRSKRSMRPGLTTLVTRERKNPNYCSGAGQKQRTEEKAGPMVETQQIQDFAAAAESEATSPTRVAPCAAADLWTNASDWGRCGVGL